MPKEAKGGIFSSKDRELILKAVQRYLKLEGSTLEERQLKEFANLVHRLMNR